MHHNNRWPTEPPATGCSRSTIARRIPWPAIIVGACMLGIAAVAVLFVWYTEGRAVRTADHAAVVAKPTSKPGIPVPQATDSIPGDGTFLVGTGAGEVRPGVYRSTAGPGCYWQRLSDLSGEYTGLIMNGGFRKGPQLVEVLSSDYAFGSQGCTRWEPVR